MKLGQLIGKVMVGAVVIALISLMIIASSSDAKSPNELSISQPKLGAMITDRYTEAVSQLPVPYTISRYKKCDLSKDAPRLMAKETKTLEDDWQVIGKCKMSYSGRKIPKGNILKDRASWLCGCNADVQQYSEKYGGNAVIVRFFASKAGYFSAVTPPSLTDRQAFRYYTKGRGAAVAFPDGSFHFKGTYRIVVVDTNHVICAYGAWWTAGYIVGSGNFTVIPDGLLSHGVKCRGNQVINPSYGGSVN